MHFPPVKLIYFAGLKSCSTPRPISFLHVWLNDLWDDYYIDLYRSKSELSDTED